MSLCDGSGGLESSSSKDSQFRRVTAVFQGKPVFDANFSADLGAGEVLCRYVSVVEIIARAVSLLIGAKLSASTGQVSIQPPHPMQGVSSRPKEISIGFLSL